ncbi:MAG: acetate--CoA ligase family protein [Candidatus Heimdallarchaeota archaeon]|nr:acetate--CoA ligase family protein [Candidatus Heimdallarchaeota archaeon]
MNRIESIFEDARHQKRTVLNYEESRKVMDLAGIPLNKMKVAKDLEESIQRANEVGYPIVLKVISEDVIHKSDSGGVKVGIKSDDELSKSYQEMMINVLSFYPDAKIEGVSVEEMVSGVELLIGTNTDSQFGKMIALGIGGIFVEVYKDVSFRLIPVSSKDVRDMIDEIKGRAMFDGFRGLPKVNLGELTSLILILSKLIEDYPIIFEMDLNPVVATENGLLAIDARIILEEKNLD